MLDEIEAFLREYLKGKRESTKRQTRIALKHWENFTKQKPIQVEQKDVNRFVYEYLRLLEPNSLSVYLFHIGKFLSSSGKKELEKYIMKIRNGLESEGVTEPSPVDYNDVLKMLTEVTEPESKLLVRLLVFSDIPIGCLEELKVRHIYVRKKYDMYCERAGKRISGTFYSDTSEIISNIIKEKKLSNDDDKIIGITERHVQNLIPDYAKKIGIKKKVTPNDLRRFGKNRDLRNWLIDEYEERKKKLEA